MACPVRYLHAKYQTLCTTLLGLYASTEPNMVAKCASMAAM